MGGAERGWGTILRGSGRGGTGDEGAAATTGATGLAGACGDGATVGAAMGFAGA